MRLPGRPVRRHLAVLGPVADTRPVNQSLTRYEDFRGLMYELNVCEIRRPVRYYQIQGYHYSKMVQNRFYF